MNLRTTEASVQAELLTSVQNARDPSGNLFFKNYTFTPLSRIRTLLEAAGRAIYLFIDRELSAIQNAIHPHTADEAGLHEFLKRYGLSWKEAESAIHTIRIGSSEAVFYDVPISQGMIVTTDGPEYAKVKFRVMESTVLPAGTPVDTIVYGDGIQRFTIPVKVECMEDGIRGNVAVGTIRLIESPPFGLDFVYNNNSEPDFPGLEREKRAQVRERIYTAESANAANWTPEWYSTQAEAHPNVARAIFKSSKSLGIPGTVKLFIITRSGLPVSQVEIDAIIADLDSDAKNPGGVARVLVESIAQVQINKTISVQYPDELSIPDQATLDNVAETWFASVAEGQDFTDAEIRNLYLVLPKVVRVVITPIGDIAIPDGSVASAGASWLVTGDVYNG